MGAAALVFISLPLVGHLIPMIELAKRLSSTFSITILTMQPPLPHWSVPSSAYLDSLRAAANIHIARLPPVDFEVDAAAHPFATMSRFIEAHGPHVRDAILRLSSRGSPSSRVAGVVTDLVTSMIDVAGELSLPSYVFLPSSAACLSLMAYPPSYSEIISAAASGGGAPTVEVAGMSPLPLQALPELMKARDAYDAFTHHGRRFRELDGIVVNTFRELEGPVFEALKDHPSLPPIFPVGPVISLPSSTAPSTKKEQAECIAWLNAQPKSSVVYLCFGSMGCFGQDQVREIAVGLERSRHAFLWVLRCPYGDADEILPDGFSERNKEKGMVWPSWAPQMEILLHPAVGGFVTHCGWNSCLESLWAGVPMLAWPLYAEQEFNACEMVKDMGVAVEVTRSPGKGKGGGGAGLVPAEEVERGVRCVMGEGQEGRRVRERVTEVGEESRRALGVGGSSSCALERWIGELEEIKISKD